MMAVRIYARKSVVTRQIVSKYNRCILLALHVRTYPDRWLLGRALTNIVRASARYIATLHSEKEYDAERALLTVTHVPTKNRDQKDGVYGRRKTCG